MILSFVRKFKVYLIFLAILSGLLLTGKIMYDRMNNKIITLEKESSVLRISNRQNETVIETLRMNSSDLTTINNELRKENIRLNNQVTELRDTFLKNDIGYLATQKPTLIQRIVNRATDKVGKDIERITQ